MKIYDVIDNLRASGVIGEIIHDNELGQIVTEIVNQTQFDAYLVKSVIKKFYM